MAVAVGTQYSVCRDMLQRGFLDLDKRYRSGTRTQTLKPRTHHGLPGLAPAPLTPDE